MTEAWQDGAQTESGLPLEPFYGGTDTPDPPPPGQFPYTRGVRADGYRGRPWTMRQYAGFGSAEQTNERFQYLLAAGQTGLSCAFDLPTQMGYDSDDVMARGEVGKVGVAIDSLDDMDMLMRGIPQDQVTTSMTINAPAALLLLLYELVAERKGISASALGGTVQNDILKEYAARGTFIFPPRPSMRLVTDTFAYCAERLPRWNTISISGYHIREAGATAPQEIAFTIANGIAYVQAAVDAGLAVDSFAPRLSFFFNVSNDFFEEVAKFRAARTIWAGVMRDRFDAHDPRSLALRFHAQTSGATLTAQQPLNNVVRVSIQALAAVLGGAQSLHTNSYDEALALPSQQAAEIALRTQQVIGFESRAATVADPLGGSHLVERLTADLIDAARALMVRVDERGGAVSAIEDGFYQHEIQDAAYRHQRLVENGERVIVGVNRFTDSSQREVEILRVGAELERAQVERLEKVRARRDAAAVVRAVDAVRVAAEGTDNLLPVMRTALAADATVGEICNALRDVFGVYRPGGDI
ncbi:MAG: methylmalonyl-CoA mutase [Candidatus Dormibacteraeota bacterium]|uniref:Methylmalonyl-CoA mutase n=1 Tax=Candidatus Amunia macphersoniae TaxID=3127014 RepID=A0A934KKN8_9BACT|nr:methylmalonyl-CoA mutase [Candidatus Dormibacteraeota bacterium]